MMLRQHARTFALVFTQHAGFQFTEINNSKPEYILVELQYTADTPSIIKQMSNMF